MQKNIVLGVSVLLITGVFTAGTVSAAGCNGVVDQLKWGCAAWDNNNGPQYPHYKKPQAQRPAPAPQVPRPVVQAPRPTIAPNSGGRVMSNDGAGIVAAGGGNAVNKSGIVAAGGGNAVNKNNQ